MEAEALSQLPFTCPGFVQPLSDQISVGSGWPAMRGEKCLRRGAWMSEREACGMRRDERVGAGVLALVGLQGGTFPGEHCEVLKLQMWV